jgi:hypothetical protein
LHQLREGVRVKEVLITFSEPVQSGSGETFIARACAGPTDSGMWEGWIEFLPVSGGEPIVSGRETTQPNRADAAYWATGLAPVYLEGALTRALHRPPKNSSAHVPSQVHPAASSPSRASSPANDGVLNPFSVFRKGEPLLRRQLGALAGWHLVNIITAHGLSQQDPAALSASPDEVLVELIVSEVRARSEHLVR